MSALSFALQAFGEAQRRRRYAERELEAGWNDAQVRTLHERVSRLLDSEHANATAQMNELDVEVQRALDLLAN